MEAIRIAIYALAVYRFTLLLYEEDGPGDVFDWLRFKLGVTVEEVMEMNDDKLEVKLYRKGESFTAKLINCPYCLSGWISLLAILGYISNTNLCDYVAVYGSLWAITYILLKKL